MRVVDAEQIVKTYRVADKAPGLGGTMRHLFRRKHRDVEAVRGVSLVIEPGEVVGFLGSNGAGKTTMLKMLAGLMQPTAGRVRVLGHDPFRREAEFLRRIALVMGNKQQLIWDLPPAETFRINAAVYGIPDDVARERIDRLAKLLELEEELHRPVRKLSLGQRMKSELIAALLHEPTVLFLDEPTLGLDVNAQAAVRSFLRTYNAERGAAILLTSHYMADITALCDRVVLIDKGSILHDGPLSTLVDRFAPLREVALELTEPVAPERLAAFGEVESCDGLSVKLLVARQGLAEALPRLLAELPVADLTVHDPPVEEVVGRVFAEASRDTQQDDGDLAGAAAAVEAGASL
ncbi:MAG: ATP-binding cassette domain-containing protein [Planctomycetota bacterium]